MNIRPIMSRVFVFLGLSVCLWVAPPAWAEERSIYAPIAEVDVQRGYIFVFDSGKPIIIQASPEAKPHVGKLPVGGMLDVVVEEVPGRKALILKSWKLHSGESECKVFDGKKCK